MTLGSLSKYGPAFQIKVISGLLNHKNFIQNVYDMLSSEPFDSPSHKWLIEFIMKYYKDFHTVPSMDILHIETKKIENDILKTSVIDQIKEAYRVPEKDLPYIETEFTDFLANQELKQALLDSVDFLNSGNYDGIRKRISNALKLREDKNIGLELSKDIETRYREDARGTIIATPWKEINSLIQGGVGKGDLSLIFGGPGGGKSWFLVALGATAALNGYNVIHYTLELSDNYTGLRYDSYLTGISFKDILKSRSTVEERLKQVKGNVIIKKYPPRRASVYTIEAHIQKCTEQGLKPDLIIIDYIDYLSTKIKGNDRKEEIDDVYISTKGLASELEIPIWSASQVNRAGAQDTIIEGDKAAGSYDKIMIADIVISLSRKRKDKVNGTGRLHIMKNRYGDDGITFNSKVDTSIGDFQILGIFNEDETEDTSSEKSSYENNPNSLSKDSKLFLKNKFFELSNSGKIE